MAKSTIQNAADDFVTWLAFIKEYKSFKSDKELANFLECSEKTLTNFRKNPESCNGRLLLRIYGYRKKAERERWI